jgi:excisionase family DNA binding protein
MESDWLTVDDVASYLKVSKRTIYRWTTEGRLKKYKVGRFNRYKKSEVDQVVEVGGQE